MLLAKKKRNKLKKRTLCNSPQMRDKQQNYAVPWIGVSWRRRWGMKTDSPEAVVLRLKKTTFHGFRIFFHSQII
jgi:hypothetical protein